MATLARSLILLGSLTVLACDTRSALTTTTPLEPSATPTAIVPEGEPATASAIYVPDGVRQPFAFVLAEGRQLVLSSEAQADWGVGELFEPELGPGFQQAAKHVDLDRLPPELRAQVGRTFDLYDGKGRQCSATLTGLTLVAHYGYGVGGLGLEEYDEQGSTIEYPPEQQRAALWATQPAWLIGELEGGCEALWARDAELPAPTILRWSDAPNPALQAYAQAFARSSVIPDMRAAYVAEVAGDPDGENWATRMAGQEIEVAGWLDAQGEVRFVELEYGFRDDSCGYGHDTEFRDFGELAGGGFLQLDREPDALAIFDADLDGRYELLFAGDGEFSQEWSAELVSESPSLQQSLAIDADGVCPC